MAIIYKCKTVIIMKMVKNDDNEKTMRLKYGD